MNIRHQVFCSRNQPCFCMTYPIPVEKMPRIKGITVNKKIITISSIIGFFNGMEYTRFVMIQGIVGAFLVRIPVSYFMSKQEPLSLFHIGLATPCSTIIQITMCFICLMVLKEPRNISFRTIKF